MRDTIVRGLSEYAPTRGFAFILALCLIAWGTWLLLPFNAFANPVFAVMASLAVENVWGGMFSFAGVTLGVGVWTKDPEWISRGAFLGFSLWIILAALGVVADPTASTVVSRATIALMHAWLYVQIHLHPELVSGHVTITDLKAYKETQNNKEDKNK